MAGSVGVFRKRTPGCLFHHSQETFTDVPQVVRRQIHILGNMSSFLDLVEFLVKQFVRDTQRHFPEQLDKTAVGIVANKRVFGLVIDFGTSQSPKSTRPLTTYWCPSRPGHQALRNNLASSLLLRTWLPYDWTPRSEAYFVFPLAQGMPGKQCGLAATGVYQPSLRSPWLAAPEYSPGGGFRVPPSCVIST